MSRTRVLQRREIEQVQQAAGSIVDVPVRRERPKPCQSPRVERDTCQLDVLEYRKIWKEPGDLKRPRDAERRAPVRRERGDIRSRQDDAAARRRQLAADQIEERGLTGAVRADDGVTGPRRQRQAHLVDGLEAAEVTRDAVKLQAGRRTTIRPADRHSTIVN
jgi:hypothetical protein